jgi:serine protease Do
MSIRSVLLILVSLSLTGVIAFAQQTTPPGTPAPPGEPFGRAFSFFLDGGSFLGVYAEDINRENMGRYGLREARGVGITSVIKDSPAEKAGLRKDDVILRIDNESVTSVRKLNRLVSEVAPDQTVQIGISRGGSEQEMAVTIGKRENQFNAMRDLEGKIVTPEGKWRIEGLEGFGRGKDGFTFAFGNNRRIGVSTTTLTKQLADYFGVTDGVLVTSVTDDGPAAKAGIKAGDVITSVDGEKVDSAGDLSRALNKKKEGEVTLTIVRDKSQRSIRVTPTEALAPLVRPGTVSGGGRRVIVPRIEIPAIPEVNISIPAIEIPDIPEVNVHVEPASKGKAKVVRVAGPI